METDSVDDRVVPAGAHGYVVHLETGGALLVEFDGEPQGLYVLPQHHKALRVVQ